MPVSSNGEIPTGINLFGGVGARGFWSSIAPPQSHVAVAVTAVAGVAFFAALLYTTNRGRLRSPWSRGIRKHALSPQQWRNLFTSEGKLLDGGVTLLKIVRSGGIHPSIRAEVWPFLLGVYDLNSTKEEREIVQSQKRKEYEKLRRKCKQLNESLDRQGDCRDLDLNKNLPSSKDVVSDQDSLLVERSPYSEYSDDPSSAILEGDDSSTRVTSADASDLNSKFSDSDSEDPEVIQASPPSNIGEGDNNEMPSKQNSSFSGTEVHSKVHTVENFSTWQRIIRLDAVRANGEWMSYDESRATVSDDQARNFADAVGLKDYDHLEPCRIYHAARLVAILEAYALYDPEIGYCQGMSDLLSPIITVISEDHQAFWCFIGFMKKARHNFRLDEVGIRRQLNIVSKIIKCKDITLYRHLEDLQAEDCFFVYRMVVVLFRRELTFEQTLCLWEVMWADQAAIRAGIGKSAWSRIRQRAPPTDDLLLYAIAASVLQKNKLIIQRHSSMDEILKECNDMAGQLDVWKLLDDAHDLVVTLHDKIETSL